MYPARQFLAIAADHAGVGSRQNRRGIARFGRVVAAAGRNFTRFQLPRRWPARHAHGYNEGPNGGGVAGDSRRRSTGMGDQGIWRRTVCSADCKSDYCGKNAAAYCYHITTCRDCRSGFAFAAAPAGNYPASGDAHFSGDTDLSQPGA